MAAARRCTPIKSPPTAPLLLLCEAAPTVRARVAERFKGEPKIRALSPEEVEKLPANSLDLVVANSLLQYIKRDELDAMLANWQRILKAGGRLVVADIIRPAPERGRRMRSRCSPLRRRTAF